MHSGVRDYVNNTIGDHRVGHYAVLDHSTTAPAYVRPRY